MTDLYNWIFVESRGSLIGETQTYPWDAGNYFRVETKDVISLDDDIVITRDGKRYKLKDSYISTIDMIKNYLDKETMENRVQLEHSEMVKDLVKDPVEILIKLNPNSVNLIHAVLGISGEAGEILDVVKKHAIYNKELDIAHLEEELGDIEFYLEQLRQILNLNRSEILRKNKEKLSKRYPKGYSDKHAQERLDKVGG